MRAKASRARLAAALLATCLLIPAVADDASALRWDDERTVAAEEAFISAGMDPPLLERPILAGRLRATLLDLPQDRDLSLLVASLTPPEKPVLPGLALRLAGGWNGSPDRNRFSSTKSFLDTTAHPGLEYANGSDQDPTAIKAFDAQGHDFLSVDAAEAYFNRPSIVDLSLGLLAGPVAVEINPEIRPASNWYREGGSSWFDAGALAEPLRLDVNVPYRGIASFLALPFELRAGRDKLHLGPGKFHTLSYNANIPWADFASARGDFGPVSFSWYLVRLNPTLTEDERRYLDVLYRYSALDPDVINNLYTYSPVSREPSKTLAIGRITWRIVPWATVALTQHNLMGGRDMQLSDLNPLIIFHDLFQDGTYSVPAMAEASVVPFPGLRLYAQYLFYDAVVADESGGSGTNAGASAYQCGLNAVLRPFASGALARSRLRFDAEFTLVDPWTYGKQLSQRQFTSRFILVEPGNGRYWIDYPIGPSFGPDGWELNLRLALGAPRGTELALRGLVREKGSVDLLGYGNDSDFLHQSDFSLRSGLVFLRPGEVPERRIGLGLEGGMNLGEFAGFRLSAKAALSAVMVTGYGNAANQEKFWLDGSLGISASLGN